MRIVANRTLSRRTRSLAGVAATIAGLAASLPAVAQAPDEDQKTSDPALYAIAERYFPGQETGAGAKRIYRLTRDQLDATAKSVLKPYYQQSIKELMPRDPLQTNYEYSDLLRFNKANIGGYSRWIGGIAGRVKQSPKGVINCAANDAACQESEARRFVRRLLGCDTIVVDHKPDGSFQRRDAAIEFPEAYAKQVKAAGFEQATADLVEMVLGVPDLDHRKEFGVSRRGNQLDPFQLLRTLTYTIADVPPAPLNIDCDVALNYVQTPELVARTVDAIAVTPEARDKLVRFFIAWLELKEPADFTIAPDVFKEFTPKLAAAMTEDARRTLEARLSKGAGLNPDVTLKDVTLATEAFVSRQLEPIYNAKAIDAAGTKPVALDKAQRLGIFTHPALLASHSGPTDTRPMKRGVFWVRKVMCQSMEPPPKELHIDYDDAKGATERDRIQALTKPAACVGCHKIINPFSYFQEAYDALGRFRDNENGTPIDTSIRLELPGEPVLQAKNAIEAVRVLTGSNAFKQCFVRQLFRFYMGRDEEPSDDPVLRRMFVTFAKDDNQRIAPLLPLLMKSIPATRRTERPDKT